MALPSKSNRRKAACHLLGMHVVSGGNAALYNDMVSICHEHNNLNGVWQNHISLWQAANVKMKIKTNFFVSTANPGHPVQDDNPNQAKNTYHHEHKEYMV